MAIFITGATGYLGSYVASFLLRDFKDRLALLVRAPSVAEAQKRLWRSFQLHMDFSQFEDIVAHRLDLYIGDIAQPNVGLSAQDKGKLVASMDSVIHCAASLNRKSEKSCLNTNLRGTLHVIEVAQAAHKDHGLKRFSEISTVAVAGQRHNQILSEDEMLEWNRSDYDPYARTKKFSEYMVERLMPEVPHTIFRPSIVMGDSCRSETTQFDMVSAFVWLARLPFLPFSGECRADIVSADYVGKAISVLHQKEKPQHSIYNLSCGGASPTYREIVEALRVGGYKKSRWFVPVLKKPFVWTVEALAATPRMFGLSQPATLMKVFLPYLFFNTVFDNRRVVEELQERPVPFPRYAHGLLEFARKGNLSYPYLPWPKASPIQSISKVA